MVCENILTSHSCNDHTKPSYDLVQYILSPFKARLEQIRFCTSQSSDMRLASVMAGNMLKPYLQPENLVYGTNEISIESWFKADDIVRNLDQLQPGNMRLVLVSTEFKDLATEEEKWYGTKWGARKISPDDMARYAAAAVLPLDQLPPEPKLPPPNQFITKKDFQSGLLGPQRGWQAQALGAADEKQEKRRPLPRALQTGEREIWLAPGQDKWAEPRCKIEMRIRPNNVFADAASGEKTDLFLESAQRAGACLLDQFSNAAMSCSASQTRDSLTLSVTGFKDVLLAMVMEFLPAWRHHQPTEADFDTIKEDFLQQIQSARFNNPSSHSNRHLDLLTSEHGFSLEQEEAALQATTFDDLREWGARIFNTAHFQFLISGDVTEAEAMELWPVCQEKLELSWRHGEEPPRRRARLPTPGRINLFKRVMVDPKSENSYVNAIMFFAASRQAKHIAAPTLLVQILQTKAFDRLRTENGLGYVAGMCLEVGPQQSVVRVYVECPKHTCLEAAEFMVEFIKEAPGMVEQLSPEELEKYREACIKTSDKKIQTLDDYHAWAWESLYKALPFLMLILPQLFEKRS